MIVGCQTVVYEADSQPEISAWYSDVSVSDKIEAAVPFNQIYAGEEDTENKWRVSGWDWDYQYYHDEAMDRSHIPCSAVLDISKINRDAAMFTDYDITHGVVRVDPDDYTGYTTFVSDSFVYTLAEPDYEANFKSASEAEEAYEEEMFLETNDFNLGDYVSGAEGTAFQKFSGEFKVYPAFNSASWRFRWVLEMPADAFIDSEGSWVYQWATYADDANVLPTMTVACAFEIGQENYNVEVYQYDDSFDSAIGTNLPLWEQNYASLQAESDFWPSYDEGLFKLKDSINGKMKQGCIAEAEIPPEEAAILFDRSYTVSVGARLYDSYDDATYLELPEQEYTYDIPALEMEETTLETGSRDTQKFAATDYAYEADAIFGVAGELKQRFSAGFSVNPYDTTALPQLEFDFEVEGPAEAYMPGAYIYQWMTFVPSGDFNADPISVACVTKVGEALKAKVRTFQGFDSMDNDSEVVVDRTVEDQNAENEARDSEKFEIEQDKFWYQVFDSWEVEGNRVQPCKAIKKFDEQLEADSEIFTSYDVTIGARFYEDDEATDFVSLPTQEFTIDFAPPVDDLSTIYEEDQPEDKSETVEYFKEKKRFFLRDMETSLAADDMTRAWMKVAGGYKLYGASGTTDRWFLNMSIEMPTEYFVDGEIFYFWVKYTAPAGADPIDNGAVACKVVIGDTQKTEVEQWIGDIDLSSTAQNVDGKRWYRQAESGKLYEPEYRANYWNENLFSLRTSQRGTGSEYSIQACEVEIELSKDQASTMTFELQGGLRIYADDDAQEFKSSPEPEFDYYSEELEYSSDLEVVPVYDKEKAQPTIEEQKVFPVPIADIEANFGADAISAYTTAWDERKSQEDAAAAGTAEANANIVVGRTSGATFRQTSTAPDPEVTLNAVNGFTVYEATTEDDFWWWYLSVEMPTSFATDGEQLFLYATVSDPNDLENAYTVGCQSTIGTADSDVVSVYTHDGSTDLDALASDNADYVVGQTILAQADVFEEDELDHDWVAGSSHAGELAEEAADSLYTNYACYFALALPKIGRNPADFDKQVDVTIGARIYASDSATDFTDIAENTDSMVLPMVPDYATQKTGAFALFTTTMATLVLLVALAF